MDCVCDDWQKNLASALFADWFYLRYGKRADSLIGELARQDFLNGKLIKITTGPGGPKLFVHKFEKYSE